MSIDTIRSMPCVACPYRQDVPSGIWSADEYAKLEYYDELTGDQPCAGFACHATPEHFCHGWAVVHNNRGPEFELLALRLSGSPAIPEPGVPLFGSGTEAADHGRRDIDCPSLEAREMVQRLLNKHDRLIYEDGTRE